MCTCKAKNCSCSEQPIVLDKPFELQSGKTYLDDSNRKVRIVCTDVKALFPGRECLGLRLRPDGTEDIFYYTKKGKFAPSGSPGHDIVSEYKEPEYKYFVFKETTFSGFEMFGPYQKKQEGFFGWQYRIDVNTGDIEKI